MLMAEEVPGECNFFLYRFSPSHRAHFFQYAYYQSFKWAAVFPTISPLYVY